MNLKKVTWNDGTMQIRDDQGSECTVKVFDEKIKLYSMTVPKDMRRQGKGKELLAAAEGEASAKGGKQLDCDFTSNLNEFSSLLESAGFELSEKGEIVSVKTEELLESTGVKKSLAIKFSGVQAFSLSELMSFQIDEIMEFIDRYHFPMQESDIENMSEDISAVAYDDDFNLRAVLLASLGENEILIQLLFGFSSKKPQFVLAVCQRFIEGIIENGLIEDYPEISMLTINENVIPLLRRLMDKDYPISQKYKVIHGRKSIGEAKRTEMKSEEGETDEAEMSIESKEYPYQSNINSKYIWMDYMNSRRI